MLIISDEVDDGILHKCMMELICRDPIPPTAFQFTASMIPEPKKLPFYGPTRGPAPLPFDMTLKRRRRR